MRIPKDMPVLTLPSMQAMMCEDTRCITLAAFGSDDDLRSYLDGLSRKDKKKMVNNAEAITGMTPLLAACRRDAVEHVRILLAFGADPSTVRRPQVREPRKATGPFSLLALMATDLC